MSEETLFGYPVEITEDETKDDTRLGGVGRVKGEEEPTMMPKRIWAKFAVSCCALLDWGVWERDEMIGRQEYIRIDEHERLLAEAVERAIRVTRHNILVEQLGPASAIDNTAPHKEDTR